MNTIQSANQPCRSIWFRPQPQFFACAALQVSAWLATMNAPAQLSNSR